MGTYKKIYDWVKQQYGFVPETCWIAHVKHLCGLAIRKAPNRQGNERVKPCPPEKVEPIRTAFRHFGMLNSVNHVESSHIPRIVPANKRVLEGKISAKAEEEVVDEVLSIIRVEGRKWQ